MPELRRVETLPMQAEGSLRLAVVADTHSAPHRKLAECVRAFAPQAILHAGDIGALEVLDGLAALAPLYVVRGNIDVRAPSLPDVLVLNISLPERLRLRILLLHIAVNGPKLRADALRLAQKEGANLVVCGHSHVPFIGRDRGVSVFNPGSAGPRRFNLPIVFGTIELGPQGIRLAHVDCETGKPWLPPG